MGGDGETGGKAVDPGFIPDLLVAGQLIPFLGAGASNYAKTVGRAPPLGRELAENLAERVKFPNADSAVRGDLGRVASYTQIVAAGRAALKLELRKVFHSDFDISPLHDLLARVAKAHGRMLLITTNYDDLVEQALRKHEVAFDVVVSAVDQPDWKGAVLVGRSEKPGFTHVQPAELARLLKISPDPDATERLARCLVFKMHGTIDRSRGKLDISGDTYVVSDEDYVNFLREMRAGGAAVPPALTPLLERKGFLFLGYSLRDWNLRLLLDVIGGTAAGAQAQAMSFAVSRAMADDEQRIWNKKNVNPLIAEFGDLVPALDSALRAQGVP